MATDGPDPEPCDQDVFTYGRVMFITNSIPSNAMERWVKEVASISGQRVDWSFFGGRAVVRALGDLGLVHDALAQLKPKHDDLWRTAVAKYNMGMEDRDPPSLGPRVEGSTPTGRFAIIEGLP